VTAREIMTADKIRRALIRICYMIRGTQARWGGTRCPASRVSPSHAPDASSVSGLALRRIFCDDQLSLVVRPSLVDRLTAAFGPISAPVMLLDGVIDVGRAARVARAASHALLESVRAACILLAVLTHRTQESAWN
jgi:hypothetical protein